MDRLPPGPRRVLRAPALKRGKDITPVSEKAKLERVLGLTVSSNASLDCDPQRGVVAYSAGCVVVLYSIRKNKQNYILSSSKKTITCLAFSWDGRYLATGECGHQPHVRVWDVQERSQLAEFPGHKHGINCVAFSPSLKYVVSVGSQHDMIVNVWDWKSNVKVASNKVSCKVKAISFSCGGNYFVTVGNRHVKFWYLEYTRSSKYKLEPVPLMGRSAILGDQRNNYFFDVACGRGDASDSTYAITRSGLLCEFNSRRLLDKWVELRASSANSICVGEDLIFIGCADGVVRCFNPFNLHFVCTLPRPHYLGVDVAMSVAGSRVGSHPTGAKYPDTVATAYDEMNKKVTCIYSDHSLYVWDVKDIKKIGKSHSFLYHSACIWGVETYPVIPDGQKSLLPQGTFLTCSSDDTIRVWNLEPTLTPDNSLKRNIYSSELLKILYVDPDLTYICDMDINPGGSNDKVDTTYDGKNGVRCLRISPGGNHLASGDRSGNIRIFHIQYMEEICKIEAHDAEVLCLEYSQPQNGKRFLSSASRDRLIHVFDVDKEYAFQQTLDDHSSSITAVRFVQSPSQLMMISCGADKSIIFRRAQFTPQVNFVREHHVVGKTTLYDMEVDVQQRHILAACQDRTVRVYSVNSGKYSRSFRGSQGEDGTLIKVVLDSSGTYLATSCTDKNLYVYDNYSGECIASMFGHSELVTGLKFTNDCRHLISVSGDGCIFVWKLPVEVVQSVAARQPVTNSTLPRVWQDGNRKSAIAITKPVQVVDREVEKPDVNSVPPTPRNVNESDEALIAYRFSMGQLPLWAKKQMLEEASSTALSPEQQSPAPLPPRGRWAQRIDGQGLVVRSYLNSDSVIPYPSADGSQPASQYKNEVTLIREESVSQTRKLNEQENFVASAESMMEIQSGNLRHQASVGPVTVRNRDGDRSRVRHPTDSSSASSSMRLEDIEAEDEHSDNEAVEVNDTLYYPLNQDDAEGADSLFCVRNTNEGDMKESQKNVRKPPPDKLRDIPFISTPDIMELNSEDEDSGTPVEGERSFLTSLSVSTENLDRLGQRERFMKSNYESLDKGLIGASQQSTDISGLYVVRHSITAKFHAQTSNGPLTPVRSSSGKHIPGYSQDVTPLKSHTKRREELTKALNEARRKLDTLGWKSNLSTSKSIGDLHNLADRDTFGGNSSLSRLNGSDSIRRSASLSDLSQSPGRRRVLPTTPAAEDSSGSEKNSAPLWAQASSRANEKPSRVITALATPSRLNRPPSDVTRIQNSMSRSSSLTSLYSSENGHGTSLTSQVAHGGSSLHTLGRVSASPRRPPSRAGLSSLSKSTSLSSVNAIGRPAAAFSVPRRLSLVGLQDQRPGSDSSSSDASPTESKDAVPALRGLMPRTPEDELSQWESRNSHGTAPRSWWQASPLRSQSERDLRRLGRDEPRTGASAKVEPFLTDRGKTNIGASNQDDVSGAPSVLPNPLRTPLSRELCKKAADELKRVASHAMQLFQRVTMDMDVSLAEKNLMTTTLAQGVWEAQQILRPAVPPMPMWSSSPVIPLEPSKWLGGVPPPLPKLGPLDGTQQDSTGTMALLQQYSDRLLSIVEQHMSKTTQDKQGN